MILNKTEVGFVEGKALGNCGVFDVLALKELLNIYFFNHLKAE